MLALAFPVFAQHAQPDIKVHRDFLLGDWNPQRPSVVMFADPFCPYCIKALKNPAAYGDVNLFLFWSPILGPASEQRVDTFFGCIHPVGKEVLQAVADRLPPFCSGGAQHSLRQLNQQMVAEYAPQSVPAHFMNGNSWAPGRVAMPNRIEDRIDALADSSPLHISWQRYAPFVVGELQQKRRNMAVFLPDRAATTVDFVRLLLDDGRFNWYLVQPPTRTSEIDGGRAMFDEFALLNGLDQSESVVVLLEGRHLSPAELDSIGLGRFNNLMTNTEIGGLR